MENNAMAELWYKGHPKYALDPRLRLIAMDTGRQEDSIRGIYWTLIALASQESPRGKLPKDVSGSLAVIMGADAAAADAVLEAFKAHGIVNRHRHISWWNAEQLLPSDEGRLAAARERCKRYRAKKAGKPVEAPAPEPKAEPKPEPEPAPKPKTVQLSLDGTPAEKPAPKARKARAPKKPALSDERLKELFDVFWAAGGSEKQSASGAWAWWRKLVHSEEQAERYTLAIGRAQKLQDALGLARFNVPKWFKERGYDAAVCTDEAVFQAELAKCAGRTERGTGGTARMSFKMMDLNAAADAFGVAAGTSGYVDVEAFEVVRNDASPMRLPQAASAFINS